MGDRRLRGLIKALASSGVTQRKKQMDKLDLDLKLVAECVLSFIPRLALIRRLFVTGTMNSRVMSVVTNANFTIINDGKHCYTLDIDRTHTMTKKERNDLNSSFSSLQKKKKPVIRGVECHSCALHKISNYNSLDPRGNLFYSLPCGMFKEAINVALRWDTSQQGSTPYRRSSRVFEYIKGDRNREFCANPHRLVADLEADQLLFDSKKSTMLKTKKKKKHKHVPRMLTEADASLGLSVVYARDSDRILKCLVRPVSLSHCPDTADLTTAYRSGRRLPASTATVVKQESWHYPYPGMDIEEKLQCLCCDSDKDRLFGFKIRWHRRSVQLWSVDLPSSSSELSSSMDSFSDGDHDYHGGPSIVLQSEVESSMKTTTKMKTKKKKKRRCIDHLIHSFDMRDLRGDGSSLSSAGLSASSSSSSSSGSSSSSSSSASASTAMSKGKKVCCMTWMNLKKQLFVLVCDHAFLFWADEQPSIKLRIAHEKHSSAVISSAMASSSSADSGYVDGLHGLSSEDEGDSSDAEGESDEKRETVEFPDTFTRAGEWRAKPRFRHYELGTLDTSEGSLLGSPFDVAEHPIRGDVVIVCDGGPLLTLFQVF